MKVSSLVFALLLVSTPVLMSGSAYADGCNSSSCKSEDPPPLDNSVPPAARSTASAVFTGTCGSSGCKSEDPPPLDQSAPPAASRSAAPALAADTCSGSSCLYNEDGTTADSDQRRAPPPPIIPCNGSGC